MILRWMSWVEPRNLRCLLPGLSNVDTDSSIRGSVSAHVEQTSSCLELKGARSIPRDVV
jgi:hypothetical protein